MPVAEAFLDSNILLYLVSADAAKADRAEAVVKAGGVISVQVLNEITNVMRRKLAMSWNETNEAIGGICELCRVEDNTLEVHKKGRALGERYGFSVYDAMIVASALLAGCKKLYSEDMQTGLVVDGELEIVNPFK